LAILSLRNDKFDKAVASTEKAVKNFKINANTEKAFRLYVFMGLELQNRDMLELAIRMFALATNMVAEEDLHVYAKDVYTPYESLLLEHKLMKDAMVIYDKELESGKALKRDHWINKSALCILGLTLVDLPERREEVFRDMCRLQCFPMSPEYMTISDLYDAYNEGSQEKFDKAARKPTWNNAEAPVRNMQLVRLVRAIVLEAKTTEEQEEKFDFV
jgi:hypothetical protein